MIIQILWMVLMAFMRSKYVQSRIGWNLIKAKQFLLDGRWVLFSGTSCQIAGLKRYLGIEYNKLITVDFICHGVPSPGVWRKYLIETYLGKYRINDICFRDKSLGWRHKQTYIRGEKAPLGPDVCIKKSAYKSPYMQGFYYNYFLRRACYNCSYKSIQRMSDLTLADAWGIELYAPEMDDNRGASVIIIHSRKGIQCFRDIKNSFLYKDIEVDEISQNNKYMVKSVERSFYRGFFYFLNRLLSVSTSVKTINIVNKIKSVLP